MSEGFEVNIKRLNENAKLPAYAIPGDAGMDLFASEFTALAAGKWTDISTGIAMEIPEGYVGLIWDKSGLAVKHGLTVLGGVVDAGYRGEIRVAILNLGVEPHIFEKGDKIAQMLIQPVVSANLVEVAELSETQRGEGRFGSTGKQ